MFLLVYNEHEPFSYFFLNILTKHKELVVWFTLLFVAHSDHLKQVLLTWYQYLPCYVPHKVGGCVYLLKVFNYISTEFSILLKFSYEYKYFINFLSKGSMKTKVKKVLSIKTLNVSLTSTQLIFFTLKSFCSCFNKSQLSSNIYCFFFKLSTTTHHSSDFFALQYLTTGRRRNEQQFVRIFSALCW